MDRRTFLATIGLGSLTSGCLRLDSGTDSEPQATDESIELSIERSFDIDAEHMCSEKWVGGIEGRSYIEPLIDSTLAIVGTGSGNLYAFDRVSGSLQWDGSIGGQINAITSSNDHVWATSEEGRLVGFTREDGTVIHRSGRDIQDMVYGEGRLVFGSDQTHVATLA